MKNILFKTQFIALLFLLITKTTIAQWSKVAIVDSFKRDREVTFVIGDTAYVGTGDSGNFQYLGDFRAYTQKGNTWVRARPFPIVGGDDGFFFVIDDTAYVGGGANPSYLNEFYAYTPSAGWINKGSAPGGIARVTGIGFSIGETGYAGTGTNYGTQLDDFWKYDPATNTWDTIPHYPHPAGGCVAFAVNGKGYVGLGQQGNVLYNDMYQYDPATNKWDTMASVPTLWGWSTASHFVICGKLIIALGDTAAPGGSFTTKQTWMFDPSNGPKGKWTRLQDFPGPLPDYAASGFTMGDTGFIYGGCNYPTNFYRAALYRYVPTIAVITNNDTTVCSGAQVILSASGGTSYVWSNTDSTSSITVSPTDTTTYSVMVNGAVCIGKDSIIVNVNNAPSLIIKPQSPKVCNGQGVTLYAPASGTGYTWSSAAAITPSGDSATATPTVTTTYSVTGTDSVGCVATGTDSVYIIPALPLIILPQPPPSFCSGSSAELKVKGGGTDFIWTPITGLSDTTSGDSVLAGPTLTTTYTVSGNDSLGCASTGTEKVIVFPAPIIPTFTQSGNTLKSSAQYQNQWYLNDTLLVGDTSQYLAITTGGEYWVSVTNEANGCSSASDSASIELAGINQVSAISDQLSIYPNPFNNAIIIKINSSAADIKDWNLQIIDVLGRTVYSQSSLNYSNDIDLSNLAGGVYFITVINKIRSGVVPVVKQN